jgi:predicted nucleic acid-binding protein
VDESAVINASPLILMSRGGHLVLLRESAARVVVPAPVADEILARGMDDVTANARGTLGLVLAAKRRGTISQARPVLDDLLASGLYLRRSVLNEALKRVGE